MAVIVDICTSLQICLKTFEGEQDKLFESRDSQS